MDIKQKINKVLKEYRVMCPDFSWDSLLDSLVETFENSTNPEPGEIDSATYYQWNDGEGFVIRPSGHVFDLFQVRKVHGWEEFIDTFETIESAKQYVDAKF